MSVGGGNVFDPGFGVVAGDNTGSLCIGVGGRVFTNFCSYGDAIRRRSVGLGVGSARNMRRHRSSVQYRSSGVDRSSSSSLFITAAGSTRTTS